MRFEDLPSIDARTIDAPTLERSCSDPAVPPIATRIREALRKTAKRLRRYYFIHVWHMQIGEGSIVSFGARLDKTNPRGVHIGKYSVVEFGAAVLAHDWVNSRDRDVRIGDNCFIGAQAIVLAGVTIGDHCIVAASSLVARNVPAGSLVAGNPARILERNIRTGHYGVREQPELSALLRSANKALSNSKRNTLNHRIERNQLE
jgi:acetyltransferase-like isoleucine patch superfamily enzyme